jgi:hypothetical protein
VVDRVGGLGLIDLFFVKDIVKGKRLLRDCHDGQRKCAAARKHKKGRGRRKD